MTLDTTATWLAAMNATSYLGVSDWRLPSMDVNGDTVVIIRSLIATYPRWSAAITKWPIRVGTTASYRNELHYLYRRAVYERRSRLLFGPAPQSVFYFPYGRTVVFGDGWPLRVGCAPGDIVPIPAAVWLLGSALGVLGWIRRKFAKQT